MTGPFTTNYTPSASRLATNGRKNCPQCGGHRRCGGVSRRHLHGIGYGRVAHAQPRHQAPEHQQHRHEHGRTVEFCEVELAADHPTQPSHATRLATRAIALFTAEPIPDREASTAPSTAAVKGDTVAASPNPKGSTPGNNCVQ